MFRLTRVVRCSINPPGSATPAGRAEQTPNAFAARPSMLGLGRHYELELQLVGNLEATGSYMLDIKEIDRVVRATALPILEEAANTRPLESPTAALAAFMPRLAAGLGGRLDVCRLRLSPFYSWEMRMTKPSTAILRQRFDFAASHRLHVPTLSPQQNLDLFGKCNHPSGHGHNYQVEPAVEVSLDPSGTPAFTLQHLEAIVEREIIQRFDHKHLNLDTREFGEGGVNPSVENIAKVFFELLQPSISPGARLAHVTVWETDRTSSTYPA